MKAAVSGAPAVTPRTKDPDATRARLLDCAFQEIYEHGYGGASLDRILSKTNLTKGALYHHFGSKAELVHAVIDEVIRGWVVDRWLARLEGSDDPISALIETFQTMMECMPQEQLQCGCPLNNLTQELANADEGFREPLLALFDLWRKGIAESLERGQAVGTVRADISPDATATFVVSAIEGLAGTAKSTRDRGLVLATAMVLLQFLETLRPVAASPAQRQAPSGKRR